MSDGAETRDEGVARLDAFVEAFRNDPEAHVLRWDLQNHQQDMKVESLRGYGHLERLAARPDAFHIVGMMIREGVTAYTTRLEHDLYPHGTPLNNLLHYCLVKWQTLLFSVSSIPADGRPAAEQLAAECGLRFANGIPTLVGGGREDFFPMPGPTVWTLETVTRPPPRAFGGPGGDAIDVTVGRPPAPRHGGAWG